MNGGYYTTFVYPYFITIYKILYIFLNNPFRILFYSDYHGYFPMVTRSLHVHEYFE